MKRYNFSLESVLSLRENIEKEWEAKLGRANSEVQTVVNRISKLRYTLDNSRSGTIDVSSFQVKCIYEDRLKFQISREEELLKQKEDERDQVKEVYLQKSMERKVIEKIKDKSLQNYKKQLIKDEILIIDELNSASKIRETMLGGVV